MPKRPIPIKKMVINTVSNLTDRLHGAWNVKLLSNELSILFIPYFSNILSEIPILSVKLLNSQAVLIFYLKFLGFMRIYQ